MFFTESLITTKFSIPVLTNLKNIYFLGLLKLLKDIDSNTSSSFDLEIAMLLHFFPLKILTSHILCLLGNGGDQAAREKWLYLLKALHYSDRTSGQKFPSRLFTLGSFAGRKIPKSVLILSSF